MTTSKPIRMAFNTHGLGDVVHCATAMRLYIDRGYDVAIQSEPNKRWVWEAARVPIYDGPDPLPVHPYYYPDMRKYFDLSEPDYLYSKAAHLFEVEELPKLGTKEEVWRDLCAVRLDAKPHISAEAHAEAEAFLEGLPHPIFVLHSKGTNWQAEKSIPDGIAFELIFKLLDTGGSVVILDYDARVPVVTGHDQVRSIKAVGGGGWGHIGCDRLCAMLQRVDLFIGVDSGPFHVASLMTDTKCLGVFRKIPPVRCCLPSDNATYLVPAKDHEHWSSRGPEWRFVEYPMDEVSATDIAVSAANLVASDQGNVMTDVSEADVPGCYIYRRVGHDERQMELLGTGLIGKGAAGCERRWRVEQSPVCPMLAIYGDHGGPTCHLKRHPDGVFRGRWLAHERMPIELTPVSTLAIQKPETVTFLDLAPVSDPIGHPSDTRADAPQEFYVGIPTLNCFDLLHLCIESVLGSTWLPKRIYVIDNSGGRWQGHPSRRIQVITPTHNLGAGGSWDFLLPAVHPFDCVMLNDGIEIAPNILEAMVKCKSEFVVGDGTSPFTACLIRSNAWKKVGPFDPVFWPAYCEDADWEWRASLLGIHSECPRSGGFKENGPSATRHRMSQQEQDELNRHYDRSKEYYIRKWGGTPRLEVFTVPFNGVAQP